MVITKNNAWQLLCQHVQAESLRKHCLAVSAAMASDAQKYNGNVEIWRITGLLHDFDYEKFPDKHPFAGVEILKQQNYPDEIIQAILGHATYSGVARETQMAKCLFAVDELCGFVMACAYVRPTKLEGLELKSVKKRLKEKSFAAKINRAEIAQGIAELGVPEDEHIALVIKAMQGISLDLGFA
ncbi:MAG: HAD family hydrolase [Candidatus Komeilibacteria bacterium RIFCSPLOWO2_02_FULL_48_11]|uniref:HAD family hydrolase n=1 Tax=Candidatus Komeilibacteria bacterium RIFCSPLOWO2_02_FULL_48_11 TaxID=1798553 RepID=A0A1G2BTI7_9BACT|nr:MAG: HAD family hydrolase [Candidatus Komeilibacteria bacterium RIFCSPLOWO2_02_FULL_48_11]